MGDAEENKIKSDLLEMLKDMMAAEHEMQQYQDDAERHLGEMKDGIADGIGASDQAKSKDDQDNSPAGRHLADSQFAVDEWENSDLAANMRAAAQAATAAANCGEKAAEVYKAIMEENQLSVGSIHGECEWGLGDIKFSIDVDFDFRLVIDLSIFKINLHMPKVEFSLHISLSEIVQLFKGIFKRIWEEIKKAFT